MSWSNYPAKMIMAQGRAIVGEDMSAPAGRGGKLVLHVAFMSRGAAGSDWESLKQKEN